MRSERQALADIAKLREQRDRGKGSSWFAEQVDIVLADVQPEPAPRRVSWRNTAGVPERRDAASEAAVQAALIAMHERHLQADRFSAMMWTDREIAEHVASAVLGTQPAPAGGTIDRKDPRWLAVFDAVLEWDAQINDIRRDDFVDRLVALAWPVEGVVLTREEAARIAQALRWITEFAPANVAQSLKANILAERLKAAP